MTTTYKVLDQTRPSATTLTNAYTVPGATSTVVSSLSITNTSATPTRARVSIAIAGAGDALSQYIYYDLEIPGNDTFIATIGATLAATDVVRVYATLATLTFQIFGSEIT